MGFFVGFFSCQSYCLVLMTNEDRMVPAIVLFSVLLSETDQTIKPSG
jgi:hypothetical protein